MKYIIAIDAGTTSSRAILFDKKGIKSELLNMSLPNFFRKTDGLNTMLMKFGNLKKSNSQFDKAN